MGTHVWRSVTRPLGKPEEVIRVRPGLCVREDLEGLDSSDVRFGWVLNGFKVEGAIGAGGEGGFDVTYLGRSGDIDVCVCDMFPK